VSKNQFEKHKYIVKQQDILVFKDEAQTALFKDPDRTAL